MTTRLLPPHDWPRLNGTLLETTWAKLPQAALVSVVEERGDIVACSALFPVWHQEGTWVRSDRRGSVAVNRHLLRAMRSAITQSGACEIYMMATTPEAAGLCRKFGRSTHLHAQHFAMAI